MSQNFDTTIGLSADFSSAGLPFDFDGAFVTNLVIANNSGVGIQYTADGTTWTTINPGGSALPAVPDSTTFFLRKMAAGGAPAAVRLTWRARDSLDPSGGAIASGLTMRAPRVVLFGDSRTADCNFSTSPNFYSTNMSWWDWGAATVAGGTPIDVVANSGIGGNTTAQMLARMDTDVIAYRPGYMTLWGGTNDPWTSLAEVAATYGRMVQMIQKAQAAGIYVFVISETVCNSSKGTTFPGYVQYLNDNLRAYCAGSVGAEFWDFNSQVVDPTSSFGYAKGAMLRDGLHLSPYGASVVGKNIVAPALSRLSGRLVALPCSLIDVQSQQPGSRNILTNPLMQGSVSASGTGQTGSWPTNWSTSGQTAVMSVPARADGYGNDLQCAITASGSGSFFATLAATPNVGLIVPGSQFVVEASLNIASAVNVSQVSVTVDLVQAGQTYRFGWGYAVQAPAANDTVVDADLVLRSRVFTVPAGTYTGLSALQRVLFAGAGSATTKLGRLALKQIS